MLGMDATSRVDANSDLVLESGIQSFYLSFLDAEEIFNGRFFLFLSHETDTSVIRISSIHSLNNSKEIHDERYCIKNEINHAKCPR